MNIKDPSWVGTISELAAQKPGIGFKLSTLQEQENLFAHRAALYFTPTSEIPKHWIHEGDISITLPVATPDYNDFIENKILNSPKIWVDLIQRNLFKIRAMPFKRALITYTRYDSYQIRPDHFIAGTKALTDAFKVRTTGRRDGKTLHYFGAIEDDAPKYVDINYLQERVEHPKDAKMRVEIKTQ